MGGSGYFCQSSSFVPLGMTSKRVLYLNMPIELSPFDTCLLLWYYIVNCNKITIKRKLT